MERVEKRRKTCQLDNARKAKRMLKEGASDTESVYSTEAEALPVLKAPSVDATKMKPGMRSQASPSGHSNLKLMSQFGQYDGTTSIDLILKSCLCQIATRTAFSEGKNVL